MLKEFEYVKTYTTCLHQQCVAHCHCQQGVANTNAAKPKVASAPQAAERGDRHVAGHRIPPARWLVSWSNGCFWLEKMLIFLENMWI